MASTERLATAVFLFVIVFIAELVGHVSSSMARTFLVTADFEICSSEVGVGKEFCSNKKDTFNIIEAGSKVLLQEISTEGFVRQYSKEFGKVFILGKSLELVGNKKYLSYDGNLKASIGKDDVIYYSIINGLSRSNNAYEFKTHEEYDTSLNWLERTHPLYRRVNHNYGFSITIDGKQCRYIRNYSNTETVWNDASKNKVILVTSSRTIGSNCVVK